MWALTSLGDGHRGSPAGWQSSVGAAAPSRCRGERGHNQSWLNLLADPAPQGWYCPVCEMGWAPVKRSGCGSMGLKRMTELGKASFVVLMPSFCSLPAAVWCRCNTCCTFSRLYGGSSLLWYMLSGDWRLGQQNLSYAYSNTQKTHLHQLLKLFKVGKLIHFIHLAPIKCDLNSLVVWDILQGFTRQLLFDERQHCKVNLAVRNDDLPLESVHCSHPWPLRVHLPIQIPQIYRLVW